MRRFLRYPAWLCVGIGLLGGALTGCSNSGSDFASMSKADQLKAAHNLPPEEIAITNKIRAGLLASMKAHQGSASGATPPAVAPPKVAQP